MLLFRLVQHTLVKTVPLMGLIILLFAIWSLILVICTSMDFKSFKIGAF